MNINNLLIALCLCTLSMFVSSDNQEAMQDLVTDLPGQSSVSFKHYAGYVPVDTTNGRAMFYILVFRVYESPKPEAFSTYCGLMEVRIKLSI